VDIFTKRVSNSVLHSTLCTLSSKHVRHLCLILRGSVEEGNLVPDLILFSVCKSSLTTFPYEFVLLFYSKTCICRMVNV
jgi:hypothetical protein